MNIRNKIISEQNPHYNINNRKITCGFKSVYNMNSKNTIPGETDPRYKQVKIKN